MGAEQSLACVKLLVYEALSYLKLLVYEAFSYLYAAKSYKCMRPSPTSVSGLKLLVYQALPYECMRP